MLYFRIRSLVARGLVDDSLSVLTDTSRSSLGNISQVSLAFIWTHKRVNLGALTLLHGAIAKGFLLGDPGQTD